jgi:hypothetical protein
MAQLSPEQLAHVEQWASEGANLNQVQDRLRSEFAINLTYLDARLLMLEVGVRIKDRPKEIVKAPEPAVEESSGISPEVVDDDLHGDDSMADGSVTLVADHITIPGAIISGKVSFSDGQKASWHMDQTGRLSLAGAPKGYQPPAADIPVFQQQLDMLMQRAGI